MKTETNETMAPREVCGPVSTAVLRSMAPGETVVFRTGRGTIMNSGSSLAYREGRMMGVRYQCCRDYEAGCLTVTRM